MISALGYGRTGTSPFQVSLTHHEKLASLQSPFRFAENSRAAYNWEGVTRAGRESSAAGWEECEGVGKISMKETVYGSEEGWAILGRGMAFMQEADSQRKRARKLLEDRDYKGCVLAGRQSIESSAKAVCVVLNVPFAKKHYFDEETIQAVLSKVPYGPFDMDDIAERHNYLRLFLLFNLWAQVPGLIQYPFAYPLAAEDLGTVISEKDAKMAVEHADECYRAGHSMLEFASEQQV